MNSGNMAASKALARAMPPGDPGKPATPSAGQPDIVRVSGYSGMRGACGGNELKR
jgi:hypothetical protein